jgi:hypothetical protein
MSLSKKIEVLVTSKKIEIHVTFKENRYLSLEGK